MTANLTFNPMATTNGSGSFNVSAGGLIQGVAMDDPSTRFRLRSAILDSTETITMWGGIGVYENVPDSTAGKSNTTLGGTFGRATNLTANTAKTLVGFSVFDQAHNMINQPQSPVPQLGSGMTGNFYPTGSLARVCVACDPALSTLMGGIIKPQVSWDFTNQLLVPYLGTLTISSGTYSTTTGLVTLTMSAPVTFSAGDAVVVSGLTGTGAFASLDGTFTALSATGTTVTYNAGASLGAATITGGSLTLGSGASVLLPCSVLYINLGSSMTVSYDPVTKFTTWNRSGNAAIIQI